MIAVDAQGNSDAAVVLFSRLNFPDCHATVIHSVESILPDGSFPGAESTHQLGEMIDEMEDAGQKAIDESALKLGGCVFEKRCVQGDPLRNLIDLARQDSCALIVVGTQDRSNFEKVLMGSVTRGLLTKAEHSFLVGKPYGSQTGPVTAVFATDHSEYCDRCADLLIEMRPAGLDKLIVLSVVDMEEVPEAIQSDTDRLATRFRSVFPDVVSVVARGEVEPNIHSTMLSNNAEMVIVGAQGHSALDRLLGSGSTSFHQVEQEPYSTLVLRP